MNLIPGQRVLSIKELTKYIKIKLESDPQVQDIWVRGEISNFTRHSSGHMYFTLKDRDSRIKSIMFASHNQRLAFMPKEGMMVLARGSISIYERDGAYQFYVTQMQPDGIGSLFLAYEQLKKKLEDEGLFAAHVKKPIPRFPRAVGVITSPTGAAVRDIVTTLQRRHPNVPVLLFPVLVQGTQAAASIARAIDEMNRLNEVDVLIVGRGGGSLEELWAFNEEVVARSIYKSVIPIISAVGHETDFTIADFVADLRAATPTAAAELAVAHHAELKQGLNHLQQRLSKGMKLQVQRSQEKLNRLKRSPYFLYPRRYLLEHAERIDRLAERLKFRLTHRFSREQDRFKRLSASLAAYNPAVQVNQARKRTVTARHLLQQAMQSVYKDHRYRLTAGIRQLDALSPLKVMQRGYSLVYDEHRKKLVKSLDDVQLGDLVKVRLIDGELDCQVWSMNGEDTGNGRSNG